MTPQDLLHHIDSGEPWPAGAGAGFDDLGSAYQCALAVQRWEARFDAVLPGLEIRFE